MKVRLSFVRDFAGFGLLVTATVLAHIAWCFWSIPS
jgi:hypothetical protein